MLALKRAVVVSTFRTVYSARLPAVRNVETTTALFTANTSYMVVPASLLVIVTSLPIERLAQSVVPFKTILVSLFWGLPMEVPHP